MSKDDFRFHFKLRVRWSEGDAQGIVFNARYLEYLEIAQSEYYRNLGILLYDEAQRTYFDTATVKITVQFKAPARVDELLEIHCRVGVIGSTSMAQHTEIYRDGTEELLTVGETVYVDYDSERVLAVCLGAAFFYQPYWIGDVGAVAATIAECKRPRLGFWWDDNIQGVAVSLPTMVSLTMLRSGSGTTETAVPDPYPALRGHP